MKPIRPAVLLLTVQALLILSIAGKYLYERKTQPRIWARAIAIDPEAPLRGRYLSARLLADGCSLKRSDAQSMPTYEIDQSHATRTRSWDVDLRANGGHLVAVSGTQSRPGETGRVYLKDTDPCDRAEVMQGVEYFIPEHAKSPLPLKKGEELWIEITVPMSGPPRPIQMAVSQASVFTILRFE